MLQKYLWRFLLVGLGGWILLDLLARLGAEVFWFQEVGYLPVFLLRSLTQALLGITVAGITIAYFWLNLNLTQRYKYQASIEEIGDLDFRKSKRPRIALRLRTLLPIAVGLSFLTGLMVAHYGRVAIQLNDLPLGRTAFDAIAIFQLGQQLNSQILYSSVAILLTISLLIYPQILFRVIAIVLSLLLGFIASQHWSEVLQYFNLTSFNLDDPLFEQDISFYIFSLPVWELISLWWIGFAAFGFLSVILTYLLSGNSLSQGWFPGFTSKQQRHLYGVGSVLMAAIAVRYWLSRYEVLYSTEGVSYGAGFTDIFARLPVYMALSAISGLIASYLLIRWIVWRATSRRRHWVVIGFWIYGLLSIAGVIIPELVQNLIVLPNEFVQERPYIQRTIALTRQGFGLDAIDAQTFNPQGTLTEKDLKANDLTVRNIRLWDERPLLDTNRQLQQIRLYYRFPDADIDRYTIRTGQSTERRQVLISARELDASAIPQQAQTWINRHLVYTHGYGFTVSPVNVVGAGGLPEYFVRDIGGTEGGALVTSSKAIRESIPIGQPRIYYGEITNNYVMTGTRQRELDYPSGSDNVYNVYDGRGGISIGSWWRRGLFAMYLKDWQVLFTREFLPESKVLFRRNINDRIRAIAPFLQYDRDPYLVAAKTNSGDLFWIVDAYTTSNLYPYSDPTNNQINYIRNSVKVVIDAHHGSVSFYVADLNDPIIQTWSKVFPDLLKPLSEMPKTLRSHVRYPVDFFRIQSERLMTYHMGDPQVFYNREDQWQIPNEVYGSEARPVDPYYLTTSLPAVPFEEFILLLPYTPRDRTNLIAWLAARSDDENYGRLLLYTFPKERLVYGTEQIEARINQDPVISQQISLWNRQGSKAIQGNLLVIPIEQSLLYVEPLYLEATQNSLPTLVRVIVAYENRIVMTPTLERSLQAIFQPEVTPEPAIIRPVEEPTPGN